MLQLKSLFRADGDRRILRGSTGGSIGGGLDDAETSNATSKRTPGGSGSNKKRIRQSNDSEFINFYWEQTLSSQAQIETTLAAKRSRVGDKRGTTPPRVFDQS